MGAISETDIKKHEKRAATQAAREDTGVKAEPVALAAMFGDGVFVTIGGRDYEVSPVPVRRLPAFGKLIDACPQQLTLHAIAAAMNGGEYDTAKTVELVSSATNQDNPVSGDTVLFSLAMGGLQVTEEQSEAIVKTVAFILARKLKGDGETYEQAAATIAEDIADDLDVQAFMDVLKALFLTDPHLRQRFLGASAKS